MRKPLIAGNWKMHKTLAEGQALVQGIRDGLPKHRLDGVDVLLCPPFQLLFPLAEALRDSGLQVGAQNAHEEAQGAFTGEVSVPMLADAGCSYAIIGHSERRQLFHESAPRLAKKVRAVIDGGLRVIYCVGETLEQREAGATEKVIAAQLDEVLGHDLNSGRLDVAYEPVWAIGTGRTATPEQAEEVHAFIRARLAAVFDRPTAAAIRILYGGSVKAGNAAGLLSRPDIDGALVGGACLVAGEFVGIVETALIACPS